MEIFKCYLWLMRIIILTANAFTPCAHNPQHCIHISHYEHNIHPDWDQDIRKYEKRQQRAGRYDQVEFTDIKRDALKRLLS